MSEPRTPSLNSSWRERLRRRALILRPPPTPGERTIGGVLLAVGAIGMIGAPLLISGAEVAGAITLGVPLAIGIAAGLLARDSRGVLAIGAIAAGIGIVVATLLGAGLAGTFCALVYAVIAFPPALLAAFATLTCRRWRRRRSLSRPSSRGNALLLIGAFTLPLAWHAAERLWPTSHPPETLTATRLVDASLPSVWESSLAFPEAGARTAEAISAPLPFAASGRATRVGDEKTIVFAKGVVRVRVAAIEPGHRLVAEVVEQSIERKALRLHAVTVTCDPVAPDRTRATLRIEFEPLMSPRWYWRPYERFFGGITFDALLDAWQETAKRAAATAPPVSQPVPPP